MMFEIVGEAAIDENVEDLLNGLDLRITKNSKREYSGEARSFPDFCFFYCLGTSVIMQPYLQRMTDFGSAIYAQKPTINPYYHGKWAVFQKWARLPASLQLNIFG